jgi:hypothetical protein
LVHPVSYQGAIIDPGYSKKCLDSAARGDAASQKGPRVAIFT